MSKETVVVLGASPKRERYSNKAVRMLDECGHEVIPIHPCAGAIEGHPVVHDLSEVTDPVDTLSLYVGPKRIGPEIEKIVALKPGRVILNPGTECDELEDALSEAGIAAIKGCTLVMLRTCTF